MIGARFGRDAAIAGGRDHLLCERDEFCCGRDIDEKDAGAIEGSESAEPHFELTGTDPGEMLEDAIAVLLVSVAEKLEGDMPGVCNCPAQAVMRSLQTRHGLRKLVENFGGQW